MTYQSYSTNPTLLRFPIALDQFLEKRYRSENATHHCSALYRSVLSILPALQSLTLGILKSLDVFKEVRGTHDVNVVNVVIVVPVVDVVVVAVVVVDDNVVLKRRIPKNSVNPFFVLLASNISFGSLLGSVLQLPRVSPQAHLTNEHEKNKATV